MRGDPAGIFLAPSPVCCGARQFGSDRRSSGLVTDMSDSARMILNRHAALLDDVGELALVHEVHFGPTRRLRISAASDGSYPASRNRLARCRYGQIFCGRPPAPTLLTCEKRAQMRAH